jgi:hypothetical protein
MKMSAIASYLLSLGKKTAAALRRVHLAENRYHRFQKIER